MRRRDQSIGQQLRATHFIEGSVRKAGDRVRITAQLIKAEDGTHIWTENYERQLTDALVFSPKAKYVYVGRDARDVFWSWYHHHSIFTEAAYQLMNPPDRTWPEFPRLDPDIRNAYNEWLDKDGYPVFPFWSDVQSWWDIRLLPNVKLIHFNGLRADLPSAIRDIAGYLDIAIDEAAFPKILEHCSLEFMRKCAPKSSVLDVIFQGGGNFINKGTNGRWKDVLSAEDSAKCDQEAAKHLSPDCAHWLKTGELTSG